jgi:uncharacterized protein
MSRAVIDVFCHWAPKAYCERALEWSRGPLQMLERAASMPVMTDLDARLRMMDRFDGYEQIPCLVSPPIEVVVGPERATDLARIANDGMAEMARRCPDRFPGFAAALPMNDPDGMVAEAERAVGDLGACGVQIFTNVAGAPIDTPEVMVLLERMAGLDRPVWLHPARGMNVPDYPGEDRSRYELWWALGWPYETSTAMYRLVFAGVFERWPHLKIITHHGGGMIPMVEGRLGPGMERYGTRTPPELKERENTPLRGSPLESFRRFYADTATFGSRPAIECAVAFFGADRMLFASDSPFDPEEGPGYVRSTLDAIDAMDLTDNARASILSGNAARILSLSAEE